MCVGITEVIILALIALVLLSAVVSMAALTPEAPPELRDAQAGDERLPSLADERDIVLGAEPALPRTGRFDRRAADAERPAPFADEIDPTTRSGRVSSGPS